MSIENISRISSKKFKYVTFLFDVPSLEDSEAIISYILTVSKEDVTIKKLEDYNGFFEEIKDSTAREIKPKSKEYTLFLKSISKYIKEARYAEYMEDKDKTDNLISDYDLLTISRHYREEIMKNTIKSKSRIKK